MTLVRRVEEEEVGDEAFAALVDLVAAARSHATLLSRHVGSGADSIPPRIVLIVETLDERTSSRLEALIPDTVSVLEVRKIESEKAQSSFLVGREELVSDESPDIARRGVEDLDPGAQRRIQTLVDRLDRVDAELVMETTDDGLEWHWRDHAICVLSVEGSRPRLCVPDIEARLLEDDEALETSLEGAIARWMTVSGE